MRKDFHQKMKQEGKSIEQLMCMFDLFRLLVRVKYMLKTFFCNIHVSEIQKKTFQSCLEGNAGMVIKRWCVKLWYFFFLLYYFMIFFWGGGSMHVSAIDLKHFKNVHREATVMFTVHVMYCYEWGMRTLENILTLVLECKHFDFIFSGIISQAKWLLIEFYLIHIGW